jgi:hypothetical protein
MALDGHSAALAKRPAAAIVAQAVLEVEARLGDECFDAGHLAPGRSCRVT